MSEEKKEKKKGMNPLMLVIVFLVIAIVGLAAYFLVIKKPAATGAYVPIQIVEASWSAGDFVVNLADSDTDKYLKTTIMLTYDSTDKTLSTDLDAKKDSIRDKIIGVVRSKNSADLRTSAGIDELKKDIVKNVNTILGAAKIINVYTPDFLIE